MVCGNYDGSHNSIYKNDTKEPTKWKMTKMVTFESKDQCYTYTQIYDDPKKRNGKENYLVSSAIQEFNAK